MVSLLVIFDRLMKTFVHSTGGGAVEQWEISGASVQANRVCTL